MNKSKGTLLNTIFEYMSLFWKLVPSVYLSFFILTISTAAKTLVMVYTPKIVIDGIFSNLPWEEQFRKVIYIGLIVLILEIVSEISKSRYEKDKILMIHRSNEYFSKKVLSLKYELLENPDVLDLKMRAEYPLEQGLLIFLMDDIKAGGISLFQIFGMGVIIFNFSPLIFMFLLIMSLLGGYLLEKNNKVEEEFTNKLMPINRRYNYYLGALVDDNFQKEFRLYNLKEVITKNLRVYMDQTLELIDDVYVAGRNIQIKNYFIVSITRIVTYSYAAIRTLGMLGNMITLGDFSLVISSAEQFTSSIGNFINSLVSISRTGRFFLPVIEFNTLEEYIDVDLERKKLNANEISTLEFRNVSFSYPKSDRVILDNISFTLNKGEALALVGRNNAGKSTIVKLIARLFEPTSGEILWNGVNIRDINLESYLRELAYVFQDFKLFPVKIWENIACKTEEEPNGEITEKINDVIDRVEMAQAINKLPDGINTYLNKFLHKDGTDFSGGESQKLAIARAIYRDASFVVLDEPTAALDPLAESEIYGNFSNLVKDRTALFISHRMSASRFCDRIIVLDNGKIIGNGSHNELLETNKLYNSLYEAQAQYYK